MECNDAASLTAMMELILITTTIDAKQKRDVMTANIPMLLFKPMLTRRIKSRVSALF
jgi:hypothetical protein